MRAKNNLAESPELGGIPRVQLLPSEVTYLQQVRTVRRMLFRCLAGAIVLVLLGVGAANLAVLGAKSALEQAESNRAKILAELQSYAAVTAIQTQVADIQSAQSLSASGEVDWMTYVASIAATLPVDASIIALAAELDSAPIPAAVGATSVVRAGTLKVTVDTPKATISNWLDQLSNLTGAVSVIPESLALRPQSGRYTVIVEIVVDTAVLANRFEKVNTK